MHLPKWENITNNSNRHQNGKIKLVYNLTYKKSYLIFAFVNIPLEFSPNDFSAEYSDKNKFNIKRIWMHYLLYKRQRWYHRDAGKR